MSTPDFRQTIDAIARMQPGMDVAAAIELADAIANAAPPLDDPQRLGKWAQQHRDVAALLAEGKKIHAIKELRALTNASLLQAKNAIEAAS